MSVLCVGLALECLGCAFVLKQGGCGNTDGRTKNVPAQPPTRTDEQIVPRSQWLTIGKSNLLFNAQKIQKNPIFQISVDNHEADMARVTQGIQTIFLTQSKPQSQSEEPKEEKMISLRKSQFVLKVSTVGSVWTGNSPILDNRSHSTILVLSPSIWKWLLRIIQKKNPQESASSATCNKACYTTIKDYIPHHNVKNKPSQLSPPKRNFPKRKLPQEVRKGKAAFQNQFLFGSSSEKGKKRHCWRSAYQGSSVRSTPKLHEVVGKGKAVAVLIKLPPDSTTGDPILDPMMIHQRREYKVERSLDSNIPVLVIRPVTSTPHVIAPSQILTGGNDSGEQEMSEVKKTDLSADVLASIRSQVPTAVNNYLGTKLDDALLKVLERHTADLIEKYSVLPGHQSL
ncbi:hypothetical protein Tco_0681628 [Tanacetum coccineum]|uniref:Uncharacterized protein n=1 Tax=Tanacetum coccineum TaxID=301880 RepID=A0ABQ4XP57_9ASTR